MKPSRHTPYLFLLIAILAIGLRAESPSPVNQVFQFMQSGTCTAWSDGKVRELTLAKGREIVLGNAAPIVAPLSVAPALQNSWGLPAQ